MKKKKFQRGKEGDLVGCRNGIIFIRTFIHRYYLIIMDIDPAPAHVWRNTPSMSS